MVNIFVFENASIDKKGWFLFFSFFKLLSRVQSLVFLFKEVCPWFLEEFFMPSPPLYLSFVIFFLADYMDFPIVICMTPKEISVDLINLIFSFLGEVKDSHVIGRNDISSGKYELGFTCK